MFHGLMNNPYYQEHTKFYSTRYKLQITGYKYFKCAPLQTQTTLSLLDSEYIDMFIDIRE